MPDPNLKYLLKKNLLNTIEASIGIDLYRNIYVQKPNGEEFDAIYDGVDSCAYFVSCILSMHGLIDKPHAIVDTTVKKMLEAGWTETDKPTPGCVIYWPKGDRTQHIGFYIDRFNAISNSSKQRQPVRHRLALLDGRQPEKFYTHERLTAD